MVKPTYPMSYEQAQAIATELKPLELTFDQLCDRYDIDQDMQGEITVGAYVLRGSKTHRAYCLGDWSGGPCVWHVPDLGVSFAHREYEQSLTEWMRLGFQLEMPGSYHANWIIATTAPDADLEYVCRKRWEEA